MNSPAQASLEKTARRRAGMKLGWYIHASVYVAVNLLLVTIAWSQGRHWAVFPLLGWGLGLAIHGTVVFLLAGSGLHERLVERERRRLQAQQGPW
ncbi:MAG: hypothetical protein JWP22_1998 [Ramlibacter sp.]|jgi:hypothetical protein|nr:hypothetical protein [Ramlibacter sp.]MDB5913323.1 hypothetical protein [Ramlibacter sp.]